MSDAPVAADLRFMREVNTTAILERLRGCTQMSVTELAEVIGLSRQAVSRSLAGLQEVGLVEFLPPDRSERRSGRPAQQVRFHAKAGYVIGGLLDPEEIRLAVADLRGTTVAASQWPLPAGIDRGEAIALLEGGVAELLEEAGIATADVYSAALGVVGIVDHDAGLVRLAPSMAELSGDVLARTLREQLDCPVYLDNDVKLAAEGERWHSDRSDDISLVVIHWGERIGAGILLDGRLYRGATNDAGDLGFLDLLVPRAERPSATSLGPFEAWAGAGELVRLAAAELARYGQEERSRELLDAGDVERVLDAVLAGDPSCTAALRDLAHRFSMGITALRALLDPHLIVLSGPLARAGQPVLEMIRESHAGHPLELPQLQISSLGRDAVVHGAVRRCLEHLERTRYEPIERARSVLAAWPGSG